MTHGTAPGVSLQIHVQHRRLRQVTTDESRAMHFAPCLAIRGPAARIAEASGARSSVGRAPPSHGGGQGFKSPRVHSLEPLRYAESSRWKAGPADNLTSSTPTFTPTCLARAHQGPRLNQILSSGK